MPSTGADFSLFGAFFMSRIRSGVSAADFDDDACASAPANLWACAFWATSERALAAAVEAWVTEWTGMRMLS